MKTYNYRYFLLLARITLVTTYLVIVAGAVVRATGSGMGCPDWPKCFGHWVPPTDASQLPDGYKEHYIEKRKLKNEKFARYIRAFGAAEVAEQIANDPSVYKELDFNAPKTWIEYANRLLGMLLGIFMTGILWMAWKQRKENKSIWKKSTWVYILLLIEGWFGSIVVSTNLLPWTITFHMLVAFGILALVTNILTGIKIQKGDLITVPDQKPLKMLVLTALLLTLLQVIIGTQVRESIDEIAARFDDRSHWIAQLGNSYIVHRLIALLILGVNLLFGYQVMKQITSPDIISCSKILIAVIIFEILIGFAFNYLDLPAFAQPLHLLNASIIFGIQYYLLLCFGRKPVT